MKQQMKCNVRLLCYEKLKNHLFLFPSNTLQQCIHNFVFMILVLVTDNSIKYVNGPILIVNEYLTFTMLLNVGNLVLIYFDLTTGFIIVLIFYTQIKCKDFKLVYFLCTRTCACTHTYTHLSYKTHTYNKHRLTLNMSSLIYNL